MTDRGAIQDLTESILADELTPEVRELVLESEPPFGVLGIDSMNRIVRYQDDGHLLRYVWTDGATDKDHPASTSEELRASPHTGEQAFIEVYDPDWRWVHPRYRWIRDELTAPLLA